MQPIYFVPGEECLPYLKLLKPIIPDASNFRIRDVRTAKVSTTLEISMAAKAIGGTQVITTSDKLLTLLVKGIHYTGKMLSINDYAGSIIEKNGVEFLICPPVSSIVTQNTGEFLWRRYFSKIVNPDLFIPIPDFTWTLFENTPEHVKFVEDLLNSAFAVACDIETVRDDPQRSIDCIGFSFIKFADGGYTISTVVIPMNSSVYLPIIRKILSNRIFKIFQNGMYDNLYLLRYSMPSISYYFDTLALFHSWYSELPKRLDFITAFLIRKWQFWKDDAKGGGLFQHYEYNARDCFTTAISFLALLSEMPEWAFNNYTMKFPVLFPALLASARGVGRDQEFFAKEEIRFEKILEEKLASIRKMVGNDDFNPSSPPQTLRLFQILGCGDVTDSKPASMDKVAFRHPLNHRIVDAITSYRKDRKLQTSYIRDIDPDDGTTKTWNGRIFFNFNPFGTDTGRGASTESSYWCGWQIQNIPRDRDDIQIKYGIVADPGFYFGEIDRSQAESRDTAYLSGDTGLIAAVEDKTKDFHAINASAFFGVDYDKIVRSTYDELEQIWVHKTLDKPFRDTSKRTNHGANYNMGPGVLLATMTIKAVIKAAQLLNLPKHWSLLKVTEYLLQCFDKTYPVVRGKYYDKIKADIISTSMLVGPTGWTRFCFGKPHKNKRDMNAYAAHPSQSLNAMEMDIAYIRVFNEVALPETKDFKLGPQIHDSFLFQYRIGRVDIVWKVAECMDNPIEVTDIFGITRTLRIPVDIKGEADRWSEVKTLRKPHASALM